MGCKQVKIRRHKHGAQLESLNNWFYDYCTESRTDDIITLSFRKLSHKQKDFLSSWHVNRVTIIFKKTLSKTKAWFTCLTGEEKVFIFLTIFVIQIESVWSKYLAECLDTDLEVCIFQWCWTDEGFDFKCRASRWHLRCFEVGETREMTFAAPLSGGGDRGGGVEELALVTVVAVWQGHPLVGGDSSRLAEDQLSCASVDMSPVTWNIDELIFLAVKW